MQQGLYEVLCHPLKIALLLLNHRLIPDSVEADQGFSLMNITKTNSRNRLGQRTVNADTRNIESLPFTRYCDTVVYHVTIWTSNTLEIHNISVTKKRAQNGQY
jgi:hypothetical protein